MKRCLEQERRERDQYIWEWNDIPIDWGCIKNKILIDREVSRMCQWPNSFDGSRMRRASIDRTESLEKWLDGSGYLSRGIEKNHKTSIEEACVERYWASIELLSSFYWAYRNKVFQGGKTLDESKQDRHHTKQQRSVLSTQTHQQLYMKSISKSKHTLNKSNQFFFQK